MIIFNPFFSAYVKKEDAHDVPNTQRRASGVVMLSMAIVIYIMRTLVLPKLSALYLDLNTTIPEISQSAPLTSNVLLVGFIIGGLYLLLTKPDYSRIDNLTRKYKKGTMIKTWSLLDYRYDIWTILAVILGMVYLITSIIAPIYSLTSQF